jgi:ribonuclease HI
MNDKEKVISLLQRLPNEVSLQEILQEVERLALMQGARIEAKPGQSKQTKQNSEQALTQPNNTGSPAITSIYTDGACTGNPGPGGWGVVIYFDNNACHELGGGAKQTTNNRMEMQAAIAALEFMQTLDQSGVPLFTDSEYVLKGITSWLPGWKRRGWKTSQGKPVLNQDLWEILDELNTPKIEWRHVRGHSGVAGNERCDVIARAFAAGRMPELMQLVKAYF